MTQSTHNSPIERLRAYWRQHRSIEAFNEPAVRRQQSQLLSSLLLALIASVTVLFIVPGLLTSTLALQREPTIYVALGLNVVCAMAYFLNRAGHYRWAALVAMTALSVGILAANALGFAGLNLNYPSDDVNLLIFLVVPVLIASILLSTHGTALVILLNVIGMFLVTLPFPQVTFAMVAAGPLIFFLLLSILILLTTRYRNRLELTRRARLAESEQRFRAAVLNAPFPIMLHAEDGEIVAVNEIWQEITGYTQDEIPTIRAWTERAYGERAERTRELIGSLFEREGRTSEGEFVVLTREGKRRIWQFHSALLGELPDGRRLSLSMAADITESKQMEEQLAFQAMLLDQIQDMVTATDLEGRITYVNEMEWRTFGNSVEDLIGQHVVMYGEDPELGATQQEIIEATRSEGRWRGEVVNITKEGRKIILDSRIQLIHNEQGEPVGMLGISTDITERKAMEQQLRQQERLAAVGQLAAGVAHDFRNLLSTIILYAQISMLNYDLPQGAARNLQTIVSESHKATHLVQQMLDFSSRAMIKPRALDLAALIQRVRDILVRTLPEHIHVTLQVQEIEAKGRTVKADPGRIEQALTNLALNARDAMPEGGHLQFSLSRVEVAPGETPPVANMKTGAWVCLAVADTGTGMTPEVEDHIFEPFFTTKEVGKGSGLGLAQVYGIVRQHNGHIDVETAPEEGTTVRIYLPAYEEQATEVEEKDLASPLPGKGETILLVEDEKNLREAGKAMLESLGYRVVTAANGREALAKCRSWRRRGRKAPGVDLVITDLVMPEMGGEELLQELQKLDSAPPVLAITGHALKGEDLRGIRRAGFAQILFKPLDLEGWAEEIRQILEETN